MRIKNFRAARLGERCDVSTGVVNVISICRLHATTVRMKRNIEKIDEHILTCKGDLAKIDQNSKCKKLTTVMEQFALKKNKVRRLSLF